MKNVFKIRTCSKSPVVRVLLFLFQCLLYNILNLLKSGLKTTVYELKSAINDGILMYIRNGHKSLCSVPIAAFLSKLREYNESRIQTLRTRLVQYDSECYSELRPIGSTVILQQPVNGMSLSISYFRLSLLTGEQNH